MAKKTCVRNMQILENTFSQEIKKELEWFEKYFVLIRKRSNSRHKKTRLAEKFTFYERHEGERMRS